MTEREVWTYHLGLPDRTGLAKYVHLVWSELDPVETMGRGAGKRDPTHWKRTASVAEWAERIRAHLADGEPRTFNAICVELTGTTADVWFDKAPDHALWQLVEARELAWACEKGATFFLLARFLSREPAPEAVADSAREPKPEE